ncbi:MAG: hypothetical protein JWQ35_731 [Bacteriovoracaceae bacterium]|nr:hypothetical protein [Bacteriovoracaceae bacterium]
MKKFGNIFEKLPASIPEEIFETIVESKTVKIERIISKGHATPQSDWYDQDKNEWVMVIKGAARHRQNRFRTGIKSIHRLGL